MPRGFSDEDRDSADMVDLELDVIRETDGAWQIDDDVWLPKSMAERHGDHFMMPAWVAKWKGLA